MKKVKLQFEVSAWTLTEAEADALHKLLGGFSQHFMEHSGLTEQEARTVSGLWTAIDIAKHPLGTKKEGKK